MIGFGAELRPHRPVRVEHHTTRAWGWRWSCRRCGKVGTRIASWRDAVDAAFGHDCQPASGSLTAQTERGPLIWTRAGRYQGRVIFL